MGAGRLLRLSPSARFDDAATAWQEPDHGIWEMRGPKRPFTGSTGVDASLLFLPMSGFLPADDPRVVGTVNALERELMRDGLLLRFKPDAEVDVLTGDKGTFLACSFWLASVYQLMGRKEQARSLFELAASTRKLATISDCLRRNTTPEGTDRLVIFHKRSVTLR